MPDETATQTGGAGGATGESKDGKTPPTFDAWLGQQPEEVKGLLEGHTKGLKTALDAERTQRKELDAKLRELSKKAEKGSDLEVQLQQLTGQLKDQERRSGFMAAAHAAGVTDLSLAYIAAQQAGLVRDDGSADFAALKTKHPALFGAAPPPKGRAGDGTGGNPPAGTMNDAIRAAAGRRV